MDITTGTGAEWAIQQQLTRFYRSLDEQKFEKMAAIMTPDGTWTRAGKVLEGREGLLAGMAERKADRNSRHILTNFVVDFEGEGKATAEFYSTAFVYEGELGPRGDAPMDLPSSVGVYTARMRLVDGEWLMEKLTSFPAFKRKK